MKNSVLVKNIRALHRDERQRFQKWLDSPLFNRRIDLPVLFLFIHRSLEKKPEALFKETAWEHLCPGQKYDEARMNLLMSLLLQQLRDFLSWQAWLNDGPAPQIYLCKALRRPGLEEDFEKAWQGAQTALHATEFRDEQYYQWQLQLHKEKFDHISTKNRMVDMPFKEISEQRQMAYMLGQLRWQCSAAAFRNMTGQAQDKRPAASEPAFPDSKTWQQQPAVRLYTCLLSLLQDPDDETAFFEAKDLMQLHWREFRETERREQYLIALNFCIRKINSGKGHFMQQAFELYRSGLENQALFENGILSTFTYKNATAAGILAGRPDWVREFLEAYRPFLHPRERHHAYVYNLAVYYFRMRDYDQAMTLLRDASLGDDSLTNLDARSMLLRIYFERGYTEALESLLDSFSAYLRRRTDIGYHKALYENLIKIVRKIIRKSPLDKAIKAAIREEIGQIQHLAERDWLLQQIN